ncbi:hypothetical protein GUJ93_ZPchr0003g17456 [Zizania palustris]|uniref:Uncharacterized protein n=1 Tax=Zizania palustris TaxID=103762 RepID=A0A8J5V6V4_ZIZPA|nr:hypothetical protein GUJ93_ZPchr0003g17456 [Zizania palustris]
MIILDLDVAVFFLPPASSPNPAQIHRRDPTRHTGRALPPPDVDLAADKGQRRRRQPSARSARPPPGSDLLVDQRRTALGTEKLTREGQRDSLGFV